MIKPERATQALYAPAGDLLFDPTTGGALLWLLSGGTTSLVFCGGDAALLPFISLKDANCAQLAPVY